MKFKQTRISWSRLLVSLRSFVSALRRDFTDDFARHLVPRSVRSPDSGTKRPPVEKAVEKPVIFASYATGPELTGSHLYCGGEKLLNNLILLLRRHGYEAYMVSTDGKSSGWLAEHAPFLSVEEFVQRKASAPSSRCVTSWLVAEAYLAHCPRFYFWDQELGVSSRSHFPALARHLKEGRIIRAAGVNRTVQAFHRAIFGTEAGLLRQLVDEKYWQPAPERRIRHRVGYFDEGEHGAEYVRIIRERTAAAGIDLEFFQLRGHEPVIIDQMQQCGVFLALNIGKSLLWGEGGPMTPQEAMACGTVPVCFDLTGAWEFIQQDYNGVITTRIDPQLMADALIGIYREPGRLEEMSRRCLEITRSAHTMEARWPAVRSFLDLPA